MRFRPPAWLDGLVARLLLRRCDAVGPDPSLEGAPYISNDGRLVVGANFRLASRPVQSHLVVAHGASLEIGDGVVIAHGAAIAAHLSVRIGSGARIAPFVTIADTDFHAAGRADAAPERTPVVIGEGVRLGSRVTVLRGSTIGDGASVVAGSVVSGEVKPGAIVSGVPARPSPPAADGAVASPAESVPGIVASALGLARPPSPGVATRDIAQWDSLGALRVLLAVEDACGVTLDERSMTTVRYVADLVDLVIAARERRAE